MNDRELYPSEGAARRSGLSVSAVRFYADVTDLSAAGHGLYDIDAIARLELVRTLREPGTGLEGFAACSGVVRPCMTRSPRTWRSSSARSARCGPGARCSRS